MARLMRMPEVAAGGTSAVLHEWSVAEQAEFGTTDVLVTVETDKAVVDVEADQPGVVVKLLVHAGATVEVGAPIAVLADPGETVGDVDAVLGPGSAAPTPRAPPDPQGAPDQPLSPPVPAALVPETVAAGGLSPAPQTASGNGTGTGTGGSSPARWPAGWPATRSCRWRTSPARGPAAGSCAATSRRR